MSLDPLSLLLLYSAMAIYAFSFVCFSIDLASRQSAVTAASAEEEAEALTASSVTTAVKARPVPPVATPVRDRSRTLRRIGVVLLTFGWLLHLGATVLRGIDAGRVPWANMYEFSLTGTLIIIAVYLGALTRLDLRYLGTFVTGLMLILLGIAAVQYYVPVSPLQPALQSYWLVLHVLVALLGTGFFAIGASLSLTQLLRGKQESDSRSKSGWLRYRLRSFPTADRLETLAYRMNLVGFILWTFTLIAGAIWAERAWGRYWGWDTKEVWTFIVWVLYAGYIHARATRGWQGTRSAVLGLAGFSAVLFNFGIVNVFFNGLHSYSGL